MITQGKVKTQPWAWHTLVLTACGFLPPMCDFRGQERKRSRDTSRSESKAGAEDREDSKMDSSLDSLPVHHPGSRLGYKH